MKEKRKCIRKCNYSSGPMEMFSDWIDVYHEPIILSLLVEEKLFAYEERIVIKTNR